MDETQQKPIRLQDLSFVAEQSQSGKPDAATESEQKRIAAEFEQIGTEIGAFFAKIFPKAIDVLCLLNKSLSRKDKKLYLDNNEVAPVALNGENSISQCKQALAAFPITMNAIVAALKSGASGAYINEVSVKLCREFNTVSAFQANSRRLQDERTALMTVVEEKSDDNDDADDFSEAITIPIGKGERGEVEIEFNVLRPDAHAVIAGMSGSGKSSLLQSLILGGAYKYSPDKLQFWVLDFKDGTGLIQFKALKHVRVMSLKNRAVDAGEIMDYIKGEYARRAGLIAESGGGDIRDYNQRAVAANKPLMPRLLIVIDEFVIMHRSCFSVLNDMAKVARSMGIGFILSSQIIEPGAAYGDAVQQANHLFEFKNSDSAFGRLVKNVSEKEKQFACSGTIGNCIYRRDTERTLFRVAYAGTPSEQSAFIKAINAKWNDYPYSPPIITGKPERKVKSISAQAADQKEIKDRFKRTKKIFVPIGESRMGAQYRYKIDRDNPMLVAFGDETRVASLEYSVIGHVKLLSESDSAVYYVDLNCNPDREVNAVIAGYGNDGEDGVRYAATDASATALIDEVYAVLKKRRQLARTDRSKDIGNPIELIIHNAERVTELTAKTRASEILGVTRKTDLSAPAADADLDAWFADVPAASAPEQPKDDDIGTVKKLKEIIENGKNSRIYVMLYFEEKSGFMSMQSELFSYNYDFKDVIVVPKIPDEYEELSYSEVVDSLTACRLREQAAVFEQTKLVQNDFICAVLVDDKVPHKIIPYEWSAEDC